MKKATMLLILLYWCSTGCDVPLSNNKHQDQQAQRATTSLMAQLDDAVVVSFNLPTTMDCGSTYTAWVKMRNTGTATWTRAAGYKLGTVDDSDPFYPTTRVWLPASASVPPNGTYTFSMTLTAPNSAGNYLTDWRMVHEGVRWFGQTAGRTVNVTCQSPVDNATVVSSNLPASMNCGSTYQAWVKMKNTGTTTWTRAAGYKLGTVGDSDPFYPTTRVWLPASASVPPNGTYTFSMTLTAPNSAGNYLTDWRMVHEGVRWFGQTAGRTVTVTCQTPVDNAVVIGHNLPVFLKCGAKHQAWVKMKNTGTTTWTRAAGYKLGTVGDSDPFYPTTRVLLPASAAVPPNGTYTFSMTLTAPNNAGDYLTDWRMVHEGVRWFGQTASQSVPVDCVDPATLSGKIMAGYQGWFGAPNDGSELNRWKHWSNGSQTPAADNITIDMWPDMREYTAAELHNTNFKYANGTNAGLYSAYSAETVLRHVRWMKEYGIDGVFVQRFVSNLLGPSHPLTGFATQIVKNIKAGAEQHKRTFAVMYDISGSNADTVIQTIKDDWKGLVDNVGVTASPRYLRHNGRPVVAIWGFGFRDCNDDTDCPDGASCNLGACVGTNKPGHPGTPTEVAGLINWFHTVNPTKYRATLMGGVPTHWRTLLGDSQAHAAWRQVYRSYDVISPWTVGRYKTLNQINNYRNNYLIPDLDECRTAGIDFMPVVFPGFSWYNLKRFDPDTNATLNAIPRLGGNFFWRQACNAVEVGTEMIYVAMFDEVDEGTAMYKLAENASQTPTTGKFVTLDADGQVLPSDWYLRLFGEATKALLGAFDPNCNTLPIQP